MTRQSNSSNDSQLRDSIRNKNISLPIELTQRKINKIVLAILIPHIYLWIAVLISATITLPWYIGLPIYFILFLAAQRAFQTIVHDSAHRFISNKMWLNDLLCNLTVAGWIGTNVIAYRKVHFAHHKYNGSLEDPEHVDFQMIEQQGGLLRFSLKYILCGHVFRLFKKYYLKSPTKDADSLTDSGTTTVATILKMIQQNWHVLVAQTAFIIVLFLTTDAWYLYLLWVYIAISWSPLLSGLRFLVEHPGEGDLTVTTTSFLLEKSFFAPNHFNYHFEHHLWPTLPPYRLAEAHCYLAEDEFFDQHPEFLNRGYMESLKDHV